jgi:predicted ATPase
MVRAPWADGRRAGTPDDLIALGAVVGGLLARAGHRVPQGVREVLAAAQRGARGYRSVVGFAHDLARCRDELRETGVCGPAALSLQHFALAWRDPVLAAGVEGQLATLAEQLAAVTADGLPRVLVLEGPAGAGRSTVLAAFSPWLSAMGVVHGSARITEGGDPSPLAGPREMLTEAVACVLAAAPDVRVAITESLRTRLGANSGLAVQLAPALAQLLGEHGDPLTGSTLDLAVRAEITGKAVIAAFTSAGPFVAMFDDAEAADDASLDVLEMIAAVQAPLLVVIARRTDAPESGLVDRLARLTHRGVVVHAVPISPLEPDAMQQVVADGLGVTDGSVAPLAAALHARSGGNPGLAIADLHTLLADGDLVVDPRTARWSWSAAALTEAPSPGVAELTRLRVARVAMAHQPVLQAAAIAGGLATPTVLAFALDRSLDTVSAVLDKLSTDQLLEWRSAGVVRFHDDALRRAAIESLDGVDRGAMRLKVARAAMVLATGGTPISDTDRFEVLQLLDGHEHALTAAETAEYARWCEAGARSAHASGGYSVALELQLRALTALGPMAWQDDADRVFDVHLRAAENALAVGRNSLVDSLLDTAWAHNPTAMQRVRGLRMLGNRWWTRQDQSGGLAEMHAILRELGVRLPTQPGVPHVVREYLSTRRAVRRRSPESFLDAPRLTDERVRASLDTMLSGVHLAYTTEPFTHMLLVLRGIRLTARHGVGASSSYFVAGYGLLLCGLGRDLQRGIGFGRAGMELAERTGGPVRTMVCFAHNGFVRHWGEPLHATIEPLLAEYRDGLVIGRGGYAHSGGTFSVLHALLSSRPLSRVDDLAKELTDDLEQLGEGAFAQRVKLVRQAVVDLRDGLDGRSPLNGSLFATQSWATAKTRRGEFPLMVYTLQAFVALAYDEVEVAAEAVRKAAPHARSAPGEAIVGVHAFQVALLHRLGVPMDARAARRAERLLRRAAIANPYDFEHRVQLLDALAASGTAAKDGLTRAAGTARANDALADLGLIASLASARTDDHVRRQEWLTTARAARRAWGAEGTTGSSLG